MLWHELSPAEYRPMKSEALASLLGIRRESAARALRHQLARYGRHDAQGSAGTFLRLIDPLLWQDEDGTVQVGGPRW